MSWTSPGRPKGGPLSLIEATYSSNILVTPSILVKTVLARALNFAASGFRLAIALALRSCPRNVDWSLTSFMSVSNSCRVSLPAADTFWNRAWAAASRSSLFFFRPGSEIAAALDFHAAK